jgi:hypothetical protein
MNDVFGLTEIVAFRVALRVSTINLRKKAREEQPDLAEILPKDRIDDEFVIWTEEVYRMLAELQAGEFDENKPEMIIVGDEEHPLDKEIFFKSIFEKPTDPDSDIMKKTFLRYLAAIKNVISNISFPMNNDESETIH